MPIRPPRLFWLAAALVVGACASPIAPAAAPATPPGPPPVLLPIDELIAAAGPVSPTDATAAELDARAARLRARADALQGPVAAPST